MEENCPRLILGIGNILLKDEGIGVHTVKRLQQMDLPSDVEIIDGGTLGFGLLPCLEGRKKIILLDAIQAEEGEPGNIYRFHPEEVRHIALRTKFSFHQTSFFDIVQFAEYLIKNKPEVVIIAVQPKDISPGMELTPEIEARIPALIKLVMEELKDATREPEKKASAH